MAPYNRAASTHVCCASCALDTRPERVGPLRVVASLLQQKNVQKINITELRGESTYNTNVDFEKETASNAAIYTSGLLSNHYHIHNANVGCNAIGIYYPTLLANKRFVI